MRPNRRNGDMARMRFMVASGKMSLRLFEAAVERAAGGEAISGEEIMLIEETINCWSWTGQRHWRHRRGPTSLTRPGGGSRSFVRTPGCSREGSQG